jgi:hypothetical protein
MGCEVEVEMDRYYRCYLLSQENRFKDVVEFFCPDDEAAIARAQQYFVCQNEFVGFELWEGGRCVCSRPEPDAQP